MLVIPASAERIKLATLWLYCLKLADISIGARSPASATSNQCRKRSESGLEHRTENPTPGVFGWRDL